MFIKVKVGSLRIDSLHDGWMDGWANVGKGLRIDIYNFTK
jgi:hypothetical protein